MCRETETIVKSAMIGAWTPRARSSRVNKKACCRSHPIHASAVPHVIDAGTTNAARTSPAVCLPPLATIDTLLTASVGESRDPYFHVARPWIPARAPRRGAWPDGSGALSSKLKQISGTNQGFRKVLAGERGHI